MGPRPLALHLGIAATLFANSRSAWPISNLGLLPWTNACREEAESLQAALEGVPPEAFAEALDRATRHDLDRFLAGVEAYQAHPYRRALADPPTVWQDGTTRLLDYGAEAADGVPVLFVPSLINRAYILDLMEESSLLRSLARSGVRPFLLDWGAPGDAERVFDLTAYIRDRAGPALTAASEIAGRRVTVAGYCMGGLLALALAQLNRDRVDRLALLATPWDFVADAPNGVTTLLAFRGMIEPMVRMTGVLPVDMLQTMFASLDPVQVYRKFSRFAGMTDAEARRFVALEDWLNDGIPLAGPVAIECLFGWYGDNTPARGAWRVDGQIIDPAAAEFPSLVVVPGRDRIVPPASAEALADALPKAETLKPALGHIGMITSDAARTGIWAALTDWLRG